MTYVFKSQSGHTFTTESREFAIELIRVCKQYSDPAKLIRVTKSPTIIRWSVSHLNTEGDWVGYEFATRELLNEIAAHRHEFRKVHIYIRGPYPWEVIEQG